MVPSIQPQHQFLGIQSIECNQDSLKGLLYLGPSKWKIYGGKSRENQKDIFKL